MRMFNIIKYLTQQGHRITLVAGKRRDECSQDNPLHQMCEKVYLFDLPQRNRKFSLVRSMLSLKPYPALNFQSSSLQKTLRIAFAEQNFDLIWVNFLVMANTIPQNVADNTPLLLDHHELEELVYQGYLYHGTWSERLFALANILKLKRFERQHLPKFKAILSVSDYEAKLTRQWVPEGVKVWTVPNGVDTDFFHPYPDKCKDNCIVLCGSMNVRRNIDATVWFAKHIFPRVKSAVPDAQFWIVGSSPTPEVQCLEMMPGVHVTGTVDDVRDYYAKSKVFVAPYRFGAGTKLKVLEAMAMGVPVVSTPVGCQGIEVVDGRHILIAKGEDDFSDRVIELLSNPERGRELANAGRILVQEKYDWKKIVSELAAKLQSLLYH